MRAATVALIVHYKERNPCLVETLSDEREIDLMESALVQGETNPLDKVYAHRIQQEREEIEFGDYIEDLLSHPFLRPEIQQNGIQWLRSKIKIEQYEKTEQEAAKIIADYAFQVFSEQPTKTDFFLAGPTAKVRIKVFVVDSPEQALSA